MKEKIKEKEVIEKNEKQKKNNNKKTEFNIDEILLKLLESRK